ncbi:response regulator transcription factor [Fulvivirgaceae bacterium PWU5]|uniref:Response regulator transcription factor n=1 Tax=Dawidia cretensis TaxID=2782350 RepID=A0AAP2GQI1_9BACT|nr:response regulator transcription factor [Dawidia cretensis]MBT1709706.1 response regulator transcription factor [Dawidia cretensis]
MKKTILWYSLAAAVFILLLKLLEYQLFVHVLSLEFYLAVIAVLCTTLGVWAGIRLTRQRKATAGPPSAIFQRNAKAFETNSLSKRELEVLELMARGLSNQEIADALFVSLNTVKTHAANLFVKLDVRRRTQAIERGKTLGLIP